MNTTEAYTLLAALKSPAISTSAASNTLRMRVPATNKLLGRLSNAGLVTALKRNLWMIGEHDPLVLVPYIIDPFEGYVSFHTALWLHGLITQIPSSIYVASMGRSAVIETPIATYSIHTMQPDMIDGYDIKGYPLATPEKALVDYLYMSPARSGLFAALPELEIPLTFDWEAAEAWANKIPDRNRRNMVLSELSHIAGLG